MLIVELLYSNLRVRLSVAKRVMYSVAEAVLLATIILIIELETIIRIGLMGVEEE